MFIKRLLLKNKFILTGSLLVLFFILTFPAYKALLHPGVLTGHDTEGHIIRLVDFHNALSDGAFPVRWAKRINFGFGSPFFNFNYPGIYFLTDILVRLGLGFVDSLKMIFLLSFPLSAFFSFLWFREKFSWSASIVGGLFYSFVPYHFLNVYVRGNLGEVITLTVMPLVFFAMERYVKTKTYQQLVFLSLLLGVVVISHNISAVIFFPILFIYAFLSLGVKTKKSLLKISLPFIMAIVLTTFFWFPALTEKHYVSLDSAYNSYYSQNFSSLTKILYSPWGYGLSNVGRERGEMSPQIGLLQLGIICVSLLAFMLKRKDGFWSQKLELYFLGLIICSAFLMISESKPIWDMLTPFHYFQFPWRFLAVISFGVSFLAASLFDHFKLKSFATQVVLIALIFSGLLFFNRNHWNANEYFPQRDFWFTDQAINSSTTPEDEHRPQWQLKKTKNTPEHVIVLQGSATIKDYKWKTDNHQFTLEASNDSLIQDQTIYFPGWTVFMDQSKLNLVNSQDPHTEGLITFAVPKGLHTIEITFEETRGRLIANWVSMGAFVILLVGIFLL